MTTDWTVYAPIVIVALVAILGFFATRSATGPNGWYKKLNTAPYSPPNWVFGVAWTILYVIITLAWMRANYTVTDDATYTALNWFFVINMALNMAWSFVFFGEGNFAWGLIIIVLMLVTVAVLLYLLSSDPWIFAALAIYFLWLLFAASLNLYVLQHNSPMYLM